jgi:hypothetical protein
MRILNPKQEALLKDERRILSDLRVVLAQLGMREDDEESLKQSIQQLEDLFLIVVVGEFNSGKSLVINALLGQRLLEEGVTPTTTQIQVLRYGPTSEKTTIDDHQVVLTSQTPPEPMRLSANMKRSPPNSCPALISSSSSPPRTALSPRASGFF